MTVIVEPQNLIVLIGMEEYDEDPFGFGVITESDWERRLDDDDPLDSDLDDLDFIREGSVVTFCETWPEVMTIPYETGASIVNVIPIVGCP